MELSFNGGRFISSSEEINYRDVLKDFSKAKIIRILTYNISKNQRFDALLNALKETTAEVQLITNIPSRDEYNEDYNSALEELKDRFDSLNIDWLQEIISENGSLYNLVTFDKYKTANQILEENTLDAYDECLDYYAQHAVDTSAAIFSMLQDNFRIDEDDFLAEIEKILSALEVAISFTDKWKAAKVNPEIDNTR